MLTEIGKVLKMIRIHTGENAREMAGKLTISPSYLSAIENGKRNIPSDLERLLRAAYPLTDAELELLRSAILSSQSTVKIDLTGLDERKKRILLAVSSDAFPEDMLSQIEKIIFQPAEKISIGKIITRKVSHF